MGMTLDQLLDETGVNSLIGGHQKTAAATSSAKPFSKLAELCRRAAEGPAVEKVAGGERELVEKTAAIAILTRTLTELAEIDGQPKTAAAKPVPLDTAVFIKAALEAGHQPAAIAQFLEKQAGPLTEAIGRGIHGLKADFQAARAGKAYAHGAEKIEGAKRSLQSLARKYEGLGDADKAYFIEKLRVKHGDEVAHSVLSAAPGFHKMPAYKSLAKAMDDAKGVATNAAQAGKDGITVGGHQVISGKQIDKLKKPAALVGAGFLGNRLLGKKAPSDSNKKGVVVVNS